MISKEFPHLLSPLTVGKVTFKNRVCMAPMGGGYGDLQGPHGEYTETALDYFTERARGGFGLIVCGALYPDNMVDPCDQSFNFMNHQGDFEKMARRMTENASYYGAKMIQQLSFGLGRNYAGLYSCSENEVWSFPDIKSPVLTTEQIQQKKQAVIEAAVLMKRCGFVGVEMHSMHWGYLLDQFTMAITNRREDLYGGTFENRMRICKELVEGVKQVCGQDFLVSMRLGLKSYIGGLNRRSLTGENEQGRTLEEAIRIAKSLQAYGYDLLDVDVGQYDTFYYAAAPMYIPQGHVIPLAAEVKQHVDIPVLCGSRMGNPRLGEEAIAAGKIDGIMLGRPAMAEPFFGRKLEMGRADKIRPCIGCNSCVYKIFDGCEHVTCALNPAVQKETYYRAHRALVKKNVLVVGGGIAGLEAARIAKMRGHAVTIYEKSDHLGGLLLAAGAHGFKRELYTLLDWYKGEIRDLKIPVVFNTELDVEGIKVLHPDAVVVAVGSWPIMPQVPGRDHPKCKTGVEVLEHELPLGTDVTVVGGGLVGCESAIDFAQRGLKVTLVEAMPDVLMTTKMVSPSVAQMIPDMLAHYKIDVKTGYHIVEVNDQGAVIQGVDSGEQMTIPADTVVMSIGMRARPNLREELIGCGIEIYPAGDCESVGNVYTAIHAAYEIGCTL